MTNACCFPHSTHSPPAPFWRAGAKRPPPFLLSPFCYAARAVGFVESRASVFAGRASVLRPPSSRRPTQRPQHRHHYKHTGHLPPLPPPSHLRAAHHPWPSAQRPRAHTTTASTLCPPPPCPVPPCRSLVVLVSWLGPPSPHSCTHCARAAAPVCAVLLFARAASWHMQAAAAAAGSGVCVGGGGCRPFTHSRRAAQFCQQPLRAGSCRSPVLVLPRAAPAPRFLPLCVRP